MEYNKHQFQKSNDKKVLHKVRKHWVVLSTALLMMIGGKAVASHVSAHADANSNNQTNRLSTIKDQMNQNLVKNRTVSASNDRIQSLKLQTLNSQQIMQQASVLHDNILRHTNLQTASQAQNKVQNTQSAQGRSNNSHSTSQNNQIKSVPASAINNPTIKSNLNSLSSYKASSSVVNPRIAQKSINNSNSSNLNHVTKILGDQRHNLGSSNIVSGKWGSANYSLNLSTGLLTVNGGQISHFQYLKSANPNDPLVQNENAIKNIKFNNVQAPSDCSAYSQEYNGQHKTPPIYGSIFNNLHDSLYNDLKLENGEFFPNQHNLTGIDASGLNTSGVTNMMGMFGDMPNLTNLQLGGQFNVSNVKSMLSMFQDDYALKDLDLQNFNASDVSSMYDMFASDGKLSDLNLDHFRTSPDLKTTRAMFRADYSLKHLNLKGFNTTQDQDMYQMFSMDNSLSDLDFNDCPSFDTSNVTNMSGMFFGDFENQPNPIVLDVSNFNTGNVTNMSTMFQDANVKKIILGNNFNTSKVTDMGSMFAGLFNIHSIGFTPIDDIYLGNHFDLRKCLVYGYWSYIGPTTGTKAQLAKDYATPDNWYSTSSNHVGVFGDDPNLSQIDFSHMHPGIDADNLMSNDNNTASVDLKHFHMVGPEILSSDGHTFTTSNGYTNEHPGITNVPNIGPNQDNPYKNYDMMATNVNNKSLVTINLGSDIAFKKDPQLDPNEAPGQVAGGSNYLDGTFYQITPSDKLTAANLADGHRHPGHWFRNKGVNVVVYVNHGKTIGYKREDKSVGETETSFFNQIIHAPAPNGYTIPDPHHDIVIDQSNKNDGPDSLPDMIGVVNVAGDPSHGTTMIPAKFYSDKGGFIKNGMVPIHYNANIGTKFVATTNNVDDIPDKDGSGGYHIEKLDPSNNIAYVLPASTSGDKSNYPSVLSWDDNNDPGNEPTAIFIHMDPLPNYSHIETVPYEFVNQQGQAVSNINYITQNDVGHTARYGDTVDLPTEVPSSLANGYEMDTSRDPKAITINASNTGDPANGQTNLVKLYIIGKPVSYRAPITVKVIRKGPFQPQYAQAQVTLSGRVGDEAKFNSSDITNANLTYKLSDGQTYSEPIIPHSDTSLSRNDSFSALLNANDTLDPRNDYHWNKSGLWDSTKPNGGRPEVDFIYDPTNIQVRFTDESNPSHHLNNGSNISAYDDITDELNHETLPNGYYVDPLHQNYAIQNDDGQRYINVNLLNDKIWTGYKWGDADVNIDTANDTIYVYGGGTVNTNNYQDGNSIFSNLTKNTVTHNSADPLGNQSGVHFTTLPNNKNDWTINIQNASVNPNINGSGLFEGNDAMSNQIASIDVSHLNTNHASNFSNMFMDDASLSNINVNGLDTSNARYMGSMFQNDPKLVNLDLDNLDTNNVVSMNRMFSSDKALKNLRLKGLFNTNVVSDMSDMFNDNTALSDLDLSNFNTGHTHEMYGMFENDDALNKLKLSAKTDLNRGHQDWGSRFFNYNVNSSGAISTANIENGNQSSDVYYIAHPVAINLVNQNGVTFNTSNHIDIPNHPDNDYHGQIADQIGWADVKLPNGYSKATSQDYTIQSPSHNPYVNVRINGNRVTVPVTIMDTTPGYNNHPVRQFNVTGVVGNLVSIPTNIPSGYQWHGNQPSNPYQYRITDGDGEGQIFDNSGTTKPVIFDVVAGSLKLPVEFIDRTPGHGNQIVKHYSDNTMLDQSALLDTTLPDGYHWDGSAPANPMTWLVKPGSGAGQLNSSGNVNPYVFNVMANQETIPVDFVDETPGHNEQVVKHYSDTSVIGNNFNLDTSLPSGYQWDQTPPASNWTVTIGNGMGQVNPDGQVNPIVFKVQSQTSTFPVKFVDDRHGGKVIKQYNASGQTGSTISLDTSLPVGYQWNQSQPTNPDLWTVTSGSGAGQMTNSGHINPIIFHVAASSEIVPVYFKDGDRLIKREDVPSQMSDAVSINTTLPTGYQWDQSVPANPDRFIIGSGNGAGQVSNDSGYTNPVVFQIKTASTSIPVEFIDRTPGHDNRVVNSFNVNGTTGSTVSINTTLPQGYYWDQSEPMNPMLWTVTGGSGAGQINSSGHANPIIFNVGADNETVPVKFVDNNGNMIKQFDVQGQTGNTVHINTTLPTGYSWDQTAESNPYDLTITPGTGDGQVADNSGYTKPVIFHVKGNSNTIPVKFIDQNGTNVGYSSVSGSVGQTVTWPTTAPSGYQINQGQPTSETLTPGNIHDTHIIHVTGNRVNARGNVTVVKMGANGEQSSDVVTVPLEGHVGDSYTFNNSDFVDVPSDYTLTNNGQQYTANMIGADPGFQWTPTTNLWDNKNNRPEVILSANQAQSVTIHYINQDNDQVGTSTLTGKVSDSESIANPSTDKNSYLAKNANSIPSDYTYDAGRNHNNQVTFSQNPQNVNIYVLGKPTSVTADYQYRGQNMGAAGTVTGRVGDSVTLLTNNVPTGFSVDPSEDLNELVNGQGHQYNHLKIVNNQQIINLLSHQMTVPVKFEDDDHDDQEVSVDNATNGKIGDTVTLPSAPNGYRYKSDQPTQYQLSRAQIHDDHDMNPVVVKLSNDPAQVRVHYVDQTGKDLSDYTATGVINSHIRLNNAPDGYVYNNYGADNVYQFEPNNLQLNNGKVVTSNGRDDMNDYTVHVHSSYFNNVKKQVQIEYENSNGTVRPDKTTHQTITFSGRIGDVYFFNPANLNVPRGYQLMTTGDDRAVINTDGTATWLTDAQHHDPTIIFKAEPSTSVPHTVNVTQVEELPDGQITGTKNVIEVINDKSVGQSYQISDDPNNNGLVKAPVNYHLAQSAEPNANENQNINGEVTADGITDAHATWYYVANNAPTINVHYRIHGHNSDVGTHEYQGVYDQKVNSIDSIPQGYSLDTKNTAVNSGTVFTFGKTTQPIVYVKPCSPKNKSVEVNVILQDADGQSINDPQVPILSNNDGHIVRGYQVSVPVNAKSDENFTITPSDAALTPYTNGFTPYNNSDIRGFQKSGGPNVTSKNKDAFIYRAGTDVKDAGTITVQYRNQNGDLINNPANHTTSYQILDGYRGRYVSDVTKLVGIPRGYQLLGNNKLDYTFNGTNQHVLIMLQGDSSSRPLNIKIITEDPNGQEPHYASDSDDIAYAAVGNTYTIMPSDYLPHGYREDTTKGRDQPARFTVQSDGSFTNNGDATFYYLSNNDNNVKHLQNVTVNYENTSNQMVDQETIQPDQVSDAYDGRLIPNVTKYATIPKAYRLLPQQDLQATLSDTESPAVTVKVDPTNSIDHNSDNQNNAQPVFFTFINKNNSQMVGQTNRRLDGYMNQIVDPFDHYSIPTGYNLAQTKPLPRYQISNHVQHETIEVVPKADSVRDYWLTVKVMTPNNRLLGGIVNPVQIPVEVPLNAQTTIDPTNVQNIDMSKVKPGSNLDLLLHSKYYSFDAKASSDSFTTPLTVTNHSEVLSATNGTLVYKANVSPKASLGRIRVIYYNNGIPMRDPDDGMTKHYITKGYQGEQFTADQIANYDNKAIHIPKGYSLDPGQDLIYTLGTSGTVNADLKVHGNAIDPTSPNFIATIHLYKIGADGNPKGHPTVIKLPITGNVGSDYIINASDYTPHGYAVDSNYATQAKGTIEASDLTNQNPNFYYEPNVASEPIYVRYINQSGQQVGTTDVINGNYGDPINVANTNSYGKNTRNHGENVPDGYTLESGQNTDYQFTSDAQYANLYVIGDSDVTDNYIVHVIENRGQDSPVTYDIPKTFTGHVGDQMFIDPTDYVPGSDYGVTSSDQVQGITITPNDVSSDTQPSVVTFKYNENPVTGEIVYKDSTDGVSSDDTQIGERPIYGTAGSTINYDNYTKLLPQNYVFDHVADPSRRLENGQSYIVYLKQNPGRASKPNSTSDAYINVEYKDRQTNQVIDTQTVSGHNQEIVNVDNYIGIVPKGYYEGSVDLKSSIPGVFETGQTPTIIIDVTKAPTPAPKAITDQVSYVNFDNGKTITTRPMTGLTGSLVDLSKYTKYMPNGYYYYKLGAHEDQLYGNDNVVYVLPSTPKIQYSTVTVNYIDASDDRTVATNRTYGAVGDWFNISHYEDDVGYQVKNSDGTSMYYYDHADNNVNYYNKDPQTVNIFVKKTLPPVNPFGLVTVKYVDADHDDKQVGSPISVSGFNGNTFDPSTFENNLPQGYDFDSIKGDPIYEFNGNQTMIIRITKHYGE